ncbi:NADH-quinone oxidoreductase subunit C/D [Desulfomonile tiedjei]|uniref:NADH/F420H2 dehydrogenase, subunit C n=1 Tax=Desulfomonile tiedjei (strain ATCC 49306 / DSM 6799 / DCB-1) TaxID=706587 RepID=I4CCT8_DESTA|nr:NADH-quinone oxidoreductase subunit C/D [Desulfomonile tiedjei]AFM27379.1 NADH/F420H2 dehydrogenase, subunit C [Desulfomonile tiedjei DSM 6799]
MSDNSAILQNLQDKFPDTVLGLQSTLDLIPTIWLKKDGFLDVLRYLKTDIERPYRMLYDISAIDERVRSHRDGQPDADFTVFYSLLSFDRNAFIRIKVPLKGDQPSIPTVTKLWRNANWHEREVWDLFGIVFDDHPNLRRILLPPTWIGHPLRKEFPARATEAGVFQLPESKAVEEERALQFNPDDWGIPRQRGDSDLMFLNMGPQHPSVHGVFRLILALDGEQIVDTVLDIGYHHRAAEKMAERQSWHTFIPYTDRVDYLGGVMNNLPYVLAVEQLAGINVPDKAKMIRIMMSEFFRISNHLVFYGTFAQDLGMMSPVFYMFNDRERVFEIVEAICGGRMHPSWFRIGGVAQDLPHGWEKPVKDFIDYFPARLDEYQLLVLDNPIFKGRTKGIASYTLDEAIEWGVTGPGLRACGLPWDFRKAQPYSGYEHLDFEIPIGHNGDCYDRGLVRVEEMRQSLRIIDQCLRNMPDGPYKSDHPLTTPPPKDRTLLDIETLIAHFLHVSWGPVIPPGESFVNIEATKGANGYYLVSDGNTMSYRTRIRTPSFLHLQMIPDVIRGATVSDLVAYLGSIDFVMSDVDR